MREPNAMQPMMSMAPPPVSFEPSTVSIPSIAPEMPRNKVLTPQALHRESCTEALIKRPKIRPQNPPQNNGQGVDNGSKSNHGKKRLREKCRKYYTTEEKDVNPSFPGISVDNCRNLWDTVFGASDGALGAAQRQAVCHTT